MRDEVLVERTFQIQGRHFICEFCSAVSVLRADNETLG
jgi:hypothetical protein